MTDIEKDDKGIDSTPAAERGQDRSTPNPESLHMSDHRLVDAAEQWANALRDARQNNDIHQPCTGEVNIQGLAIRITDVSVPDDPGRIASGVAGAYITVNVTDARTGEKATGS